MSERTKEQFDAITSELAGRVEGRTIEARYVGEVQAQPARAGAMLAAGVRLLHGARERNLALIEQLQKMQRQLWELEDGQAAADTGEFDTPASAAGAPRLRVVA